MYSALLDLQKTVTLIVADGDDHVGVLTGARANALSVITFLVALGFTQDA